MNQKEIIQLAQTLKATLGTLLDLQDEHAAILKRLSKIEKHLATDLTGRKFGKLTVVGRGNRHQGKDGRKRKTWDAVCECGKRVEGILPYNLTSGNTTSCGCNQKVSMVKHGHSKKQPDTNYRKSPTYVTWNCMKTRCECKTHNMYYRYGGRGISVCERWQNFENFLEDMGERPSADHQIHRLDGDGDYERDNCVWVHKDEHPRGKYNA